MNKRQPIVFSVLYKGYRKTSLKLILVGGLLALTEPILAQDDKVFNPDFARDLMMYILLGAALVTIGLILWGLLEALKSINELKIKALIGEEAWEAQRLEAAQKPPWWNKFMNYATDLVPIEEETDILLNHNYDGIQELDNNLPPWWLWMFYASIVFGFFYIGYVHFSPYGQSSHEQYEAEMLKAEIAKAAFLERQANLVNEANITLLTDASSMAKGKSIYLEFCATCHLNDGGGNVGPNFTDKYWLHGGDIKSVFKTVKYGVPEKGMIAWKDQLSPVKMHQVSSYILSLQGTTPEVPKAPQGELWEEE